MKRFKNRLHGLYADLGKREILNTDIQTIPPPSQKLTPYLFGKSAKYCLLTILFFLPFINSFAQTTFNSSDGNLTFTVTNTANKTVSVKAAKIWA